MRLPAFQKLPFSFDPQKLLTDFKSLKQSNWQSHYNTQEFEGDWSILPLRSIHGHPTVIHASPNLDMYDDTPLLLQSLYFKEVIDRFKCPLASVRLMRLAAGANILEHTDDMGDEDVRIHIPIQTHPDVQFWINRRRVPMQVGEVWMGDFNLPHAVCNKSPIDRIHLVLDAQRNEWLDRQIFNV